MRLVREGPPKKMVAGEGPTKKIRRRRIVEEGLTEKVRWRWSNGEGPPENI